ncbi:hypothetical protein G6F22_019719 [Rhizopus arrhizus]|nr:hypothetical protein G6F22_019719 [Rhizopus arrhizus]
MRHGRRVDATGDQPREVRHVGHEDRAHVVGDGTEPRKVQRPGIGRAARNDQLGPFAFGNAFHVIHVHALRYRVDPIAQGLEPAARHVDLGAVRQMPSRLQVQAKDLVSGRQQRQIDGLVRLASRMGLHVHVSGAEQQLRPGDRDVLCDVHVHAAAVVAASGIAFSVLRR